MLVFVIKSTICLCIVYFLYMILLAKENMPVFKRYYLLFGLLFSAIIPFVEFNMNTQISETIRPIAVNYQINRIYSNAEILPHISEKAFSIQWIPIAVYFLVFIILLTRYIVNIFQLIRQKNNNSSHIFKGYRIVLIDQCSPPYSFLDTIYMNKEEYRDGAIRKEIFIHELTHIRQRHSADILLVELWQVIFWFNPLLWFYKREMKLNHEYLADNRVVDSEINVQDYQNFMLNAVFKNNVSYFLTSNYNYLFIKNRLVMLTKKKSLVRTWIKGTILVSLIALMSIAISCNNTTLKAESETKNETEWWMPILQKHNLELGAYNNFGDVFEMAMGINSINNGICTLKTATVIIKDIDSYMIIEADSVYHDIKNGFIEFISGSSKTYKMGNTLLKPYETGTFKKQSIKFETTHPTSAP